jgi:hypothetical protein
VRVPLPHDYDSLRRDDRAAALEIRLSSRAWFTDQFTNGMRPEWFDGSYIFVDRSAEPVVGSVGPSRRQA